MQAFDVLVNIVQNLQQKYAPAPDNEWIGSPFAWLKEGLPSRTIGKIGEEIVAEFCKRYQIPVSSAAGSDADLVIGHTRVEVKFSTLWEGGSYRFQQIRDQDYKAIVALGISPRAAHCWVLPKEVAIDRATNQHGGRRGRDTWWLEVKPDSPPECLSGYGGTLEDAIERLRSL